RSSFAAARLRRTSPPVSRWARGPARRSLGEGGSEVGMAAQITSYAGLKAGMLAWLARSGDTLLDSRFDDFLHGCERRMYYGHATEEPGNPLRSDPLRIVEMEATEPSFALQATVAQPESFVELISILLNSPQILLDIVSQRTLDAYGAQRLGGVA